MALEIVSDVLRIIIAGGLVLAGILSILIWIRDKTRNISYLRIFVQIASLIAIFYLFTMTLWLSIVLVVIVVATVVLGRFFCGWICPFGLYMDLMTQFRKSFKIGYLNLSEKVNRILHYLRYAIFAIILIPPFVLFFLDPLYPQKWLLALFFRGPFQPLAILLSPLEPLIVPWGETLGFKGLSLSYPYARDITYYANGSFLTSLLVFIFIALTVESSLIVRRFWCRFCPTGVSIAIVNRFRHLKWIPILHINKVEEKCTKCGICKRVCPLQVTEVYEQKGGDITTSMCMQCFRCVEMCPYEDCLKVKVARKTVFRSRDWLQPSKSD